MSLTAQNIVDSCSQDVRSVIQSTGNGLTILLDYVDRVQKDCLHSGIYEPLSRDVATVATVAATASYALTPTDIRSVSTVYDRTTERLLLPLPELAPPPGSDPVKTRDVLRIVTNGALPEYFRSVANATLYLFPTPLKVLSLEVHYAKQVTSVAAGTDVLTVPEDGKDVLVAGVNFLASIYLGRPQEAQIWASTYQQLKGAPSVMVANSMGQSS